MANLPENPVWDAGIYQLETTDVVEGGADGIDNVQAKALANRTSFLLAALNQVSNWIPAHEAAVDPHSQYLTPAEVQANAMRTAVAGGAADAITAVFAPVVAALTSGMLLCIRAGAANATATPTFTPAAGAIAAKTIVKSNGSALVAGDIAGAGYWIELKFDATLDKWVLLNPATGMATVTAANDATYVDNSVKPASTSWVRSALGTIFTALGFTYSFVAAGGFIKFPSILGAWIFQWGMATSGAGGNTTITYPMAFPSQTLRAIAGNPVGNINNGVSGGTTTNFTTGSYVANTGVASVGTAIPWIAIGN